MNQTAARPGQAGTGRVVCLWPRLTNILHVNTISRVMALCDETQIILKWL